VGNKRRKRRPNASGIWPEPEEITNMRAELADDREAKLGLFRWTHDREPDSDFELDQFIESLIREQYNNGFDTVQYPWV
jgi:hypothetical protein